MPHSVLSHLGLPMFHKKDARLTWVNFKIRHGIDRDMRFWYLMHMQAVKAQSLLAQRLVSGFDCSRVHQLCYYKIMLVQGFFF